jgi:tetratricopeptide (TPR) repeat protein
MHNVLKLMLLGVLTSALTSALPPRAMAQTTTPLLQVEGSLEAGDATLGDGSFFDSHEFTGQAEQTVTILLESEAFDVYLILEDDQGNRIAVNDDIRSGDTNAALIVTLPAAGRYRVLANAYRADGQGPYRLTLQPSPAGEPNPLLSAAEVTLLGATQQFQAGIVRYRRSEFQAALTLWQQALAGFRAAHVRNDFPQDSRQGEAAALGGLGIAYDALGDYAQAIDFHQQQLEIARQIGDRQGEANALGNLGIAYFSLGDSARAIDFYQQALEIARQIGDRQGEAAALGNLGNAYGSLGDYSQAIDFHQQALVIKRQIGDRRGEATALGNLGIAYESLGDSAQAIDFHQQHLEIARQIGDRQGEAAALGNLGNAYFSLGDSAQAIDFHQQSLEIARQIGDRQGEAAALGNLGNAYGSLGDYSQAIDFHQQSLVIKRQIGDRQGEATALGNLGNAYFSLGDYSQAIDFHQQQLEIARQIGDRQGEAVSLGNLGNAYGSLGDYARAIDFHQQSLVIKRQIGDRQGEAASLNNLGNAYFSLGDYPQAIDFYQQSLEIKRQIGDRRGEANSRGNLGNVYFSLGDYPQAIDFYQQQLEIARQIGDRRGEASALGNLGSAYRNLGDYQLAIDFHQQSLEIKRQIGDRQGASNALGNLGNVYFSLGDYPQAIDFHQQALEIAHQIGDRQGEANALHNLGVAFLALEDLIAAERYFQASAEVQESLHTEGLADANRLSLLDSQQVTYNFWQQTLVAQGQPAAALAVAERSRAQALAVSMARSLEAVPAPPDLAAIQAIAAQQAATLVSYAVLPSGRIFIWVVQPDGTLHFAESDDAALDDSLVDTAAVLAGLGDDAQGGESPETPLNTLVQDTQAALTVRGNPSTPPTNKELSRHLQQLHGLLIEPIDQWLPEDDTQRVIFIPHRELFRIPFAALRDENGTYLIQKHTILTAPSIQSLALARQHRDRIQTTNATEALIVGNPTLPAALQQAYDWQALPGAEDEARRVGTYLSEHLGIAIDVLYQDQATETVVKDRLHSARFIHLATHGTLASSEEQATLPGLYSFIPGILALAPSRQDDGSLTADELLEITLDQPLNVELVVLSACQTGQGPITSDGVYGLSRVLLTAGAPTLVVSLWNASDPHTVALMDEFYRQFLEEDEDKAQALRQAMLMMIDEKEEDPNPQYWAAFTLVGNPE